LPGYFYPKSQWERLILTVINRLRRISSPDKDRIKAWSDQENLQLFLVTARFSFLENLTLKWLTKNNLTDCFSQVFINDGNQDPVRFKASVINDQNLNAFVDDDLEVLEQLASSTRAKLFWLVPRWRQKRENGHDGIVAVSSIEEVLKSFGARNSTRNSNSAGIVGRAFPKRKAEID